MFQSAFKKLNVTLKTAKAEEQEGPRNRGQPDRLRSVQLCLAVGNSCEEASRTHSAGEMHIS